MSITRINHFEAAEGKSVELRDFLRGVVAVVERQAGCQSCQLLRELQEPRRIAMVEVWESVAHHQAAAKAIPPEQIAQVMPLLAVPPRGNYFEADAADLP